MIPTPTTMTVSQSTVAQALVRHDARQFFLDNCREIYEEWTAMLEKTTLPTNATSSDQRILAVLETLDACRDPDHPRSFRLASIQLARVLNNLKEKVKEDRRRGVIAGEACKGNASVVVDIYCKATGKQRADVHTLSQAAKRWSALGRDSLLVLTLTEQDAKIVRNTSIPISKLEAIGDEITRMYPPELICVLKFLSHDGVKMAGSDAPLELVKSMLKPTEHAKPKMLTESLRPSTSITWRDSFSQQREHNNPLSIKGLSQEQPIVLTSNCETMTDVVDADYEDTPQLDTLVRSVDALSTSRSELSVEGIYTGHQSVGFQNVHQGKSNEKMAITDCIPDPIADSSCSRHRAAATSYNAAEHAAIHTSALPSAFSDSASPEMDNYFDRHEPRSTRQKSPIVSPSQGRASEDAQHCVSDDFRCYGTERIFQSDKLDVTGHGGGTDSRERLASVPSSEGSGQNRGHHCADTAITEHAYAGSYAGFEFEFHTSKNNLKLPYSLASYRSNATGWADPNASCGFCEPTMSAVKVPSKRKRFPTVCSCNDKRASYKKLEAIDNFISNDKGQDAFVSQAHQSCWQRRPLEDVLIGHAGVWELAHQHAIMPLMELACQNMVQDLAWWTLSVHSFIPILESLIQHIYDNRVTEGQKIRQIVPQFVACVAEDVSALSGWDRLLTRFPAFASDYARAVTGRFA